MVQTIADILGIPLIRTTATDTTDPIGAAVLAGVGAGIYEDYEAVERFRTVDTVFTPNSEHAMLYQNGFEQFQALRDLLREFYRKAY